MNLSHALVLVAALATPTIAQTQLVRGDVDGIRHTAGRFQLECTDIPLVSSTVNLQALHDASRQQDIEYELQVVDVGSAGSPILDVISATAIPEQFDMGNLRFGRSETWEVFGPASVRTWILIDMPANVRYQPLGAAGTWLLGPTAVPFAQGMTNVAGRFQTRFTMPTIPALVGQTIIGQAVVEDGNGGFDITNPDCREVRSD